MLTRRRVTPLPGLLQLVDEFYRVKVREAAQLRVGVVQPGRGNAGRQPDLGAHWPWVPSSSPEPLSWGHTLLRTCLQVCDFGLSKLLGPTPNTASSTNGGGANNPLWLAPEILNGGRATAASDVFSFGLVLYEMLTWRLPWEGKTAFEVSWCRGRVGMLGLHLPRLPG